MSDDLAGSHPLPLVRGTARQVALDHRKRRRAALPAILIGAAISGVKATLDWGWLGIVAFLGILVIMFAAGGAVWKLSAVRLRAAFGDPAAFAVAFSPLDFADYKRFGGKKWRQRSYRALLVLDGVQLTFLPDEKGRRKGREEFSLPLADIRAVVVSHPRGLPPGTMAFVGLETRVLHFQVLDRGVAFVAALRAAGVAVLEEHRSEPAGP